MSYNFKKNLCVIAIALVIGLGLIATPKISKGEVASSSGSYTVLAPLPCIEGGDVKCTGGNGALQEKVDFKTYVQYTFNLLIGLSAAVAVIQLVWGGIEYIVTTSITGKKTGLDRAKNAIYGLLLVLTSFIILRTVDPRFTEIPNTLVPKIEFNSLLTEDAYSKLIGAVDDDAKKYNIKGEEIGKDVQNSKNNVNQSVAKINEIDKKIRDLKNATSSPENSEEIAKLENQRKQELEIVNQNIIRLNIDEFRVDINGLVRDSVNRISDAFIDTYNQSDIISMMKQIRENKNTLNTFKEKRIKNIQTLGAVDIGPITRLDTYGQNLLNLQQIKLSNLSVREIKPSGKVEMVNADGTVVTFPSKESTKKFLLSWTRIIKSNGATLSVDPELQKSFDSECDSMTTLINQNQYLN